MDSTKRELLDEIERYSLINFSHDRIEKLAQNGNEAFVWIHSNLDHTNPNSMYQFRLFRRGYQIIAIEEVEPGVYKSAGMPLAETWEEDNWNTDLLLELLLGLMFCAEQVDFEPRTLREVRKED